VEVFSAREMGYLGNSDEFHFKKASEIGAVILTYDTDFLRMAIGRKIKYNGIIFSNQKTISVGQFIRGVELIVNTLTCREMANHIEFYNNIRYEPFSLCSSCPSRGKYFL